ncbi:MAG TPA: ABC transporter permease [Candidatus Acidoferrales bacterium]|nr:ABC transporter permease [Candidatus Acidoferrales bacterium]
MKTLMRLRFWLRAVVHRSRTEGDMETELRFHIEARAEDLIRTGISREEALRRARMEFGGVDKTKEECREARGINLLESLLQDLRYGVRMLRKSPGFTAVAVLTLALGIGANTAIFSIVDAVLLRAFPYPDADQLVFVFNAPVKQPDALSALSYRDLRECREQNRVFSEMAGNAFHDLTLTGAGEPSIVNAADVTPEIFSLLGAKPLAGRTLAPEDGKPGAAPVAMVSENLWRSRFGANPGVIGKSINLDMRSFVVVGILPASFHYPDGAARQDVWIAAAQDPLIGPFLKQPGVRALGGIARLKPGISMEQAQAEMTTAAERLAKEFPPQDSGLTIRVQPYRQAVVGNMKSALLILLGAVGLVLLIACANIANLLLSRATSRSREIAVRIALGAGRARIVRQLLTESALLGLLGGIAGVLLALWSVWILRPFLPPEVMQINSIHIGEPVLAFALVLSLAAAMAFGLAPALLATPSNLQTKIKQGGERGGQRGGQRVRSFLAVAEISLAMVLLVAGGLLIRSFALVTAVNPGFDPNHVIEAEISLPQFQYSTPQQWSAFANELLARLHALPGMEDSALAAPLPMDRQGEATFPFTIAGNPSLPPGKSNTADYATVSPDYFRVMRIPLLRGRFFTDQDSPSNPKIAIISETLAQRYFPNEDPVGRQMKFGFPPNGDVSREIVGIAGDVRDESLGKKPGPMMYVPFAQAPLYGGEIVVRSSLNATSVAAGIRQATHAIDEDLPITDIASFPDMIGKSIAQERFRTLLLGSFSAIALVLAAVGIFGVISYSAAQRTHEIGVRMALGAQPRDVLCLILGQGAKLALFGLCIGIVAALLLTRLMASMLYRISATDPLTFFVVAILLLGVALLACYIPARRAMRVDPMVALRYE